MEKNNNNLNVPNLRFPEFDGEWETHRLGELVEIKSGVSPTGIIDENGLFPFYKVEQLNMGQSLNPLCIIKIVTKIRHLVKKYNPDIVYCHSSMAGGMGRLACLGLPVRVIYNPAFIGVQYVFSLTF